MNMLKTSIIALSFFSALPAFAGNKPDLSGDEYDKCVKKIADKSTTGGSDFYDKVIKKCGYEKFTSKNCDSLYNELYLTCNRDKNDSFCSADIGYFALFKNFDDNKLSKSCTDKKQLSREEFGKIFCEGK